MISGERWRQAQEAEAAWHRGGEWSHVGEEVRAGAKSLLRINSTSVAGKKVIDVGSGPKSILIDVAHAIDARGSVALDPLTFSPVEEGLYARFGIRRAVVAVEDLEVPPFPEFDEAWCYNCLQHVKSVEVALRKLMDMPSERVRLFEWLNVPTTVNHPHVLKREQLRSAFSSSWSVEYELVGNWWTPDFSQEFLAIVARRK